MARPVNRMRPVHPGEVLREDYLAPLGLSVNALSVALGVPATRIHEIVKERRAVTADTAARLAKHFGGDATSWLVMQANYDLKTLPTLKDIERVVSVRDSSLRNAVKPNPSLKRSANGRPLRPGRWCAHIFTGRGAVACRRRPLSSNVRRPNVHNLVAPL